MKNHNKWINEEDEDNSNAFKHDESIDRFMENPDAIIAGFFGFRYIFKVKPGHIDDVDIINVEELIRHTAIDYEYTLYGMDVANDRIEIQVGISVTEAPIEGADVFQKHLKQSGINTELLYIGTLDKQE